MVRAFLIGAPRVESSPQAGQSVGSWGSGWTPDGRLILTASHGMVQDTVSAWKPGGAQLQLDLPGTPTYAEVGDGVVVLRRGSAVTPAAIVTRAGRTVTVLLTPVPYSGSQADPIWSPDGTHCALVAGGWTYHGPQRLVLVAP